MSNVREFTPKPPEGDDPNEFLFAYHEMDRVLIDGHAIPLLRGKRDEEVVTLLLDNRFLLTVPSYVARDVAGFVANAIAIGQGYPWYGAKSKDKPFAPTAIGLSSVPEA